MLTPNDEQELLRLTGHLEAVHDRFGNDPDWREALQKAALALSVVFIHGMRSEVEKLYGTLDKPLPEFARDHLLRLGLDPDSDAKS